MILYCGQPNCVVSAPHGNSHHNRPFVRTNPSILQKIKEAVTATSGEAGPSKLYKEAVRVSDDQDSRTVRRDMKQVFLGIQNLVYRCCECLTRYGLYVQNGQH